MAVNLNTYSRPRRTSILKSPAASQVAFGPSLRCHPLSASIETAIGIISRYSVPCTSYITSAGFRSKASVVVPMAFIGTTLAAVWLSRRAWTCWGRSSGVTRPRRPRRCSGPSSGLSAALKHRLTVGAGRLRTHPAMLTARDTPPQILMYGKGCATLRYLTALLSSLYNVRWIQFFGRKRCVERPSRSMTTNSPLAAALHNMKIATGKLRRHL